MRVSLLAIAVLFCACSKRTETSLLLISLDTVRADQLGSYGSRLGLTPHLDSLARESILFQDVTCQVPLTTPSHASILTGLLPQHHGIRNNESFKLKESVGTLAESLRRAGYQTGAFIGAFPLDSRYGLGRGFDLYDDAFLGRTGVVERRADEVLSQTLPFIRENASAGRPFFAFVHLFDAHSPYEPPSPFRERLAADRYGGEIAYLDDALGRFVKTLRQEGWLDRMVVSILSDHGEALGEHGENTHGALLYESTLRVPWMVRLPDAKMACQVVSGAARTIDVAPTLLGFLGLPRLEEVDGINLAAFVEEGRAVPELAIYSETLYLHLLLGWAELRSLRKGSLKLIDSPQPELYDLAQDPPESLNVFDERPEQAGRLKKELAGLRDEVPSGFLGPSAEVARRLATLGYAGGMTRRSEIEARDPKAGMAIWREIEAGTTQLALDRARARLHFERALELDPANGLALKSLADIELAEGKPEKALALYQQSLRAGFVHPDLELALARTEGALGRVEKALALLSAIRESPEAILESARLELSLGRAESARKHAENALASRPANVAALSLLGRSLRTLGKAAEAEKVLRRALALSPEDATALNELGSALAEQGRAADAEVSFRDAIRLAPEAAEPRRNLGLLLRGPEAEALLREALRLRPGFPEARVDLAKHLAESGRPREAEAEIRAALRLRPEDPEGVFVGARVAELLGRRSDAIARYRHFLELAPPTLSEAREMARRRLEALVRP